MDALLGVVLVAQLPSQQAEVIFQFPPPPDLCEPEGAEAGTSGNGSASAPSLSPRGTFAKLLSEKRRDQIPNSTQDLRAQSRLCFGIPAMIFAKLMLPDEVLSNRRLYLELDAGNLVTSHPHDGFGHLLFASFPCTVVDFGVADEVTAAFADAIGEWDVTYDNGNRTKIKITRSGIVTDESKSSSEMLSIAKGSDAEDGWQFRLEGFFGPEGYQKQGRYELLKVASGQLVIRHWTGSSWIGATGVQDLKDALQPMERVVRFNVVHVLDSLLTCHRDTQTRSMWQVSAHLSRALVCEEKRAGYLSREVRSIMRSQGEADSCEDMTADKASQQVQAQSSLARLLVEMFEGVRTRGYRSLQVNGQIACQVCMFPKPEPLPEPPSADQALALTCIREDLEQELPLDSADVIRSVLRAASPSVSLGELVVRLALPLSSLQRIAQHLVFWRKARVVDVFLPHTRVAVAPGADISWDSPSASQFHEWQRRHMKGSLELTFSEVISSFSGGRELQQVEKQLSAFADLTGLGERSGDRKSGFSKLLEWLVAEGLLVQLATFYHFLPDRARASPIAFSLDDCASTSSAGDLLERHGFRQRFCPALLSEDELSLLGSRAQGLTWDERRDTLLFLCKFVVDFAKKHCRGDGTKFAALAESFSPSLAFGGGIEDARRLIDANDDILVPYVCRC